MLGSMACSMTSRSTCYSQGNLPLFIADFLHHCKFHVCIGSTLSAFFPQEGVPRGFILSVTLFLHVNQIFHQLPPTVHATGYGDDLEKFCSSVNMNAAENQLQSAIPKLSSWASNNGFVFSTQRIFCIHFCYKLGLHSDSFLKPGAFIIHVVNEMRFLGLHFDCALTFKAHVQHLKVHCTYTLNIQRSSLALCVGGAGC